jgi:hypothetical protein
VRIVQYSSMRWSDTQKMNHNKCRQLQQVHFGLQLGDSEKVNAIVLPGVL